MDVERWKQAVEAGSNNSNYRRERGMTETRDDAFVDGVQWADEHPRYLTLPKNKLSGAELIARERLRQIDAKGYNAEHDTNHSYAEFLKAAITYLNLAIILEDSRFRGDFTVEKLQACGAKDWPWEEASLKPSLDIKRMIEKGCALGAAAIDRLKMDEEVTTPRPEPSHVEESSECDGPEGVWDNR